MGCRWDFCARCSVVYVCTDMHVSESMRLQEGGGNGKKNKSGNARSVLTEWIQDHLEVRGTNTATRTMKGTYVTSDTTAIMRHRVRQDFASNGISMRIPQAKSTCVTYRTQPADHQGPLVRLPSPVHSYVLLSLRRPRAFSSSARLQNSLSTRSETGRTQGKTPRRGTDSHPLPSIRASLWSRSG